MTTREENYPKFLKIHKRWQKVLLESPYAITHATATPDREGRSQALCSYPFPPPLQPSPQGQTHPYSPSWKTPTLSPALPAVSLTFGQGETSRAACLPPGHQSTIHQPVQGDLSQSTSLCCRAPVTNAPPPVFLAQVLISKGTERRAPPALNQTLCFCLEPFLKVPQKTLLIA